MLKSKSVYSAILFAFSLTIGGAIHMTAHATTPTSEEVKTDHKDVRLNSEDLRRILAAK